MRKHGAHFPSRDREEADVGARRFSLRRPLTKGDHRGFANGDREDSFCALSRELQFARPSFTVPLTKGD